MRPENQEPDPEAREASLWDVDRLLAGDLGPEEKAAVEKSIAASPELSAYADRMRNEVPRRSFRDLQARIAEAGGKEPETGRARRPARGPGGGRLLFGRAHWAIAALMALALGLAVRFFPDGERAADSVAYRNKGGEAAEIRLRSRNLESGPGGVLPGAEGDTIAFLYRSPRPLYVQVWMAEPGKPPQSASGEGPAARWDAASSWKPAPGRLILEGKWPRQEILVAAAGVPFDSEAARQAVADPSRAGKSIRILRFRIEKKP